MSLINKISLAVISVSLGSTVFGASVDKRVSELEKQMKEVRAENAMGNSGVYTAPARADVDGYGFFIWAGPIYQEAHVGGTEFVYTDQDPAATLPIRGRVKDIDFDWDWGFRVGIGANVEHDNWDVNLWYTHFDSSGSKSVDGGFNGSLIPLKSSASIVGACNGFTEFEYSTIAKSQFDADFNIINLELGRPYFISRDLSFRPHLGLESTWIDLQQVTRYSGGNLDVNTVHVKGESDFWGLGPRGGLDSKWFLAKGFNIFGNLAAALLYGRFDVDHREKFSLCQNTNRISLSANTHKFVPTVQVQLGLGWDRYFNDQKQHVGIRLGYDASYFWRANQMIGNEFNRTSTSRAPKMNRTSEDVSMHGLMIDARVTF